MLDRLFPSPCLSLARRSLSNPSFLIVIIDSTGTARTWSEPLFFRSFLPESRPWRMCDRLKAVGLENRGRMRGLYRPMAHSNRSNAANSSPLVSWLLA